VFFFNNHKAQMNSSPHPSPLIFQLLSNKKFWNIYRICRKYFPTSLIKYVLSITFVKVKEKSTCAEYYFQFPKNIIKDWRHHFIDSQWVMYFLWITSLLYNAMAHKIRQCINYIAKKKINYITNSYQTLDEQIMMIKKYNRINYM
jgi:hypothetical protein